MPELLETSIKALEIAKLVTAQIPIPGLSTAVGCALGIAKKAKDIKDTRDDCRALAERAAALVLAVYHQLKHGSSETGVKEHVATFLQNLQAIENLMDRRLRPRTRDRIRFMFNRGKIADEAKMLTTKLEDSFRAFMIQAALVIDENMNTLTRGNLHMLQHIEDSARVGEIVAGDTREIRTGLSDLAQRVRESATFDGNFRLFAREDISLLEPAVDSYKLHHTTTRHGDKCTLVRVTDRPRNGRVSRYRGVVEVPGRLSGKPVVVYAFPNCDDQLFVEAVKFAKKTCHPYILTMLGYSRPGDPGEAAYIVTEDYLPLEEYVGSVHGSSRLRVLMRMEVEICMAVEHLVTQMELRQLLPIAIYWDSTAFYPIGLGEVAFDCRHGGRIKWARDPLTLEKTVPDKNIVEVPLAQRYRMRIIEDLRAVVAYTGVEAVVQQWFVVLLAPVGVYDGFVPGRSWWKHWDNIADYPQYPLGVWLGRNSQSSHEDWTCLSARNPGFQLAVAMQSIPTVVLSCPKQGDGFDQRNSMCEWLQIPDSDLGEMCLEFELGTGRRQTKWKRYQFSCLPVNTTLLFQQRVHVLKELDTPLRVMRALPDPSTVGLYAHIGIAAYRVYYTETTVTMSAHAAEQAVPTLWFFVLQFDGSEGYRHCNIPCGFWSAERCPTSVPEDIIFDPTPQFERIEMNIEAPLFTSIQVLGDLVFTTQTKMTTLILQLTEDELIAFREFQESHSTSDADASGPDDPQGRDGLASSSIDGHALRVHCELPESNYHDAADAGYVSTEDYYTAEEDEATAL